MPNGALRECRYPTCPRYQYRDGFCRDHQDVYDVQLPPGQNLRPSNLRFRRLRRAFLMRHPMCAVCKRMAASDLDHITPHRGDPALFWDQRNWQGLCHVCHARKTATETIHRASAQPKGGWKTPDGLRERPPRPGFFRAQDTFRVESLPDAR